ncbi:hypothetical protein ASG90_12835 [Nocardioides sp. Soil797]|nr:hypothetical protein ASG90_12835 [Nocardioides sp. Soil797]
MTRPLSAFRRGAAAVAATFLATLVLTSCGSDDDGSDASGDDVSSSVTPSREASESASASTPESTDPVEVTSAPPSSSDSDPSDPASGSPVDDLFLSADEMPGLNDVTVWSEAGTKPEDGKPFGDCAKFALVDSGAEEAWVRSFTSEGAQEAYQLIATFADAKSAWRAEQVLRGWHRDCAAQLNADVEKINPIQAAKVSTGKAFTYLVQFGKEDADVHHFNGVAVNRSGPHLSVVLIDNEGQDYNYEAGQEPAQQAARAVAKKLG